MNPSQIAVNTLCQQINQSVIGQEHVVQALVIGLITNGHVLLEGLPGTAKTRSIKALSESLSATFGRIQFTPDLLPSDVTGTEVYQELDGKPTLTFQPGPIFNQIVLADEINRAPAKVQSALLEAMAEGTLTVAGETHTLPDLFMVLATQNPIEQEGTYPLPEAQMDRFLMKVDVAYPDSAAELAIIRLVRGEEASSKDSNVKNDANGLVAINPEHILEARQALQSIHISDVIENYLVNLVMATRTPDSLSESKLKDWLVVGASPRATIALDKCSRAHAWLNGRDYVEPDDVRAVIYQVLGHRLVLSFDALSEGVTPNQLIDELLEHVVIG